jgi:preprotein translocase subunit YajC
LTIGSLFFIVALLILMWFLLIQPQRRRQQQQRRLMAELAVGDEVMTMGGLYGHVRALRDDDLTLEIAPDTEVRVSRNAIAARVAPEAEESPPPEAEETPPPT